MSYCHNCGAQTNPNWRTCPHCGVDLMGGDTSGVMAAPYASWGSRAVALIIDGVLGGVLATAARLVGAAVSDSLSVTLYLLAAIGFSVWNSILRQGSMGQTIGKTMMGISVVSRETRRPIGYGVALARTLVPTAITIVTLGVYAVLDYLWPLWDDDNQRITDKILSTVVITGLPAADPNPGY